MDATLHRSQRWRYTLAVASHHRNSQQKRNIVTLVKTTCLYTGSNTTRSLKTACYNVWVQWYMMSIILKYWGDFRLWSMVGSFSFRRYVLKYCHKPLKQYLSANKTCNPILYILCKRISKSFKRITKFNNCNKRGPIKIKQLKKRIYCCYKEIKWKTKMIIDKNLTNFHSELYGGLKNRHTKWNRKQKRQDVIYINTYIKAW